jgi:phospholipid/cholesterol/gamma-HCH transport system substrate-binding protein
VRPTVKELRPTVEALRDLLGETPGLLDTTHSTFPQVRTFMEGYQPALSYLRPYVPETVGWLQNWGKNFGAYDSQGHLWAAILGQVSPQAFDEAPVKIPPLQRTPERKPGDVVGQPWDDPDKPKTDANGSPIQ